MKDLVVCVSNGHSPATLQTTKPVLNQYNRFVCDVDVVSIDTRTLRRWLLEQRKTCKANAINTKIITVRSFFNWLCEEEIIDNNPLLR